MNTTAIETRTHATSAKKSNENRVYINGTVAGKNLRAREVQNRPGNEDLIRGLVQSVYEDLKVFIPGISDEQAMSLAQDKVPYYYGVIVA